MTQGRRKVWLVERGFAALRRATLRPPGPFLIGSAVLAVGVSLWAGSLPGLHGRAFFVQLVCWTPIASVVLLKLASMAYEERDAGPRIGPWWRWVPVPALAMIAALALTTGAPMRARLSLSASAVERAMDQVGSGPLDGFEVQRLGLLTGVHGFFLRDQGAHFTVSARGMFHEIKLAYQRVPPLPPGECTGEVDQEPVEHELIVGPWYEWWFVNCGS